MEFDNCRKEEHKALIKRIVKIIFYILIAILGLLCAITKPVIDWTIENFGVSVREILYTIVSPMKGADTGFLEGAIVETKTCVILFSVCYICYLFIDIYLSKKDIIIKLKFKNINSLSLKK